MNKRERHYRLINRLQELGFTYDEANQLRRIEMTLHRWAELECGDGNDYCSWSIERDEETGKPFMVTYPHDGKSRRRKIADREAGALRRLRQMLASKPELDFYQQTDPRGCALYLVRKADLRGSIESSYTNGVAVCD